MKTIPGNIIKSFTLIMNRFTVGQNQLYLIKSLKILWNTAQSGLRLSVSILLTGTFSMIIKIQAFQKPSIQRSLKKRCMADLIGERIETKDGLKTQLQKGWN